MNELENASGRVGRRAILICPGERVATRFLAQAQPFAALHAFAKPLIVYWIEHLAAAGAKQITILANDRVEQLRAITADGSRWGVEIEFIHVSRELTVAEARENYCGSRGDWMRSPLDVSLMEHFPGLSEYPIFKSYANWFNALRALLPRVTASARDMREVKPGVWVSARARVSAEAELRAPCWIGPHTVVAGETTIGPMAVLEDRVIVETGVEIANSAVAPETFVGRLTELKDSIADGSILINWRSASCARVPDAFLLCSLSKRQRRMKSTNWLARLIALIALGLGFPLALLAMGWGKMRGQPTLCKKIAVRPNCQTEAGVMATVVYRELGSGPQWLRAWPQLWNIFRGDFAWVGNRPLSPGQVVDLTNDFERLWLAAPIGLISMAQAEGAIDALETRAWASLYALQANWRLDISILVRALVLLTKKSITALF